MVAPSDPGVRATQVGGFIFVAWELRYNALQVQAEKAGISRIAGLLMGKILVIPHFPPARRNPPPYSYLAGVWWRLLHETNDGRLMTE